MITLPKYLLQKKFMMESVIFIFAFSVVYMFLYKPFSATVWFGFATWRQALLTILFYIVAITIMVVSKFVLVVIQKRVDITAPTYIGLVLVEFVLVSLLYILITSAFTFTDVKLTAGLVLKTMSCVALILAIPYSFFVLYTAYRSAKDENRMLRTLLETSSSTGRQGKILDLHDTFGNKKITIPEDSIYYIESQDNYVKIYYELEGKLVSYMLRLRTQQMEEALQGTNIHRCHRSYFVNFSKVSGLNHNSRSTSLSLSHPDLKQIPVSKTYYRTVISANLV